MEKERMGLLAQLESIGVALPKSTKMPNDALSKRLHQALDASQRISEFAAAMPLDPSKLEKWSAKPRTKSLMDAFQRVNLAEATEIQTRKMRGLTQLEEQSIFMEVRQGVLQFAKLGEETPVFVLKDEIEDEAVIVRVRLSLNLTKNATLLSNCFFLCVSGSRNVCD